MTKIQNSSFSSMGQMETKQDWKHVICGVHWHSKGVLHNISHCSATMASNNVGSTVVKTTAGRETDRHE
jgi:hypothetical protein